MTDLSTLIAVSALRETRRVTLSLEIRDERRDSDERDERS